MDGTEPTTLGGGGRTGDPFDLLNRLAAWAWLAWVIRIALFLIPAVTSALGTDADADADADAGRAEIYTPTCRRWNDLGLWVALAGHHWTAGRVGAAAPAHPSNSH